MVETAGDALQECGFVLDCQNPEKSARHLMKVNKRTEGAQHPRPQVLKPQVIAGL